MIKTIISPDLVFNKLCSDTVELSNISSKFIGQFTLFLLSPALSGVVKNSISEDIFKQINKVLKVVLTDYNKMESYQD